MGLGVPNIFITDYIQVGLPGFFQHQFGCVSNAVGNAYGLDAQSCCELVQKDFLCIYGSKPVDGVDGKALLGLENMLMQFRWNTQHLQLSLGWKPVVFGVMVQPADSGIIKRLKGVVECLIMPITGI